jgi:hypothetical protein
MGYAISKQDNHIECQDTNHDNCVET